MFKPLRFIARRVFCLAAGTPLFPPKFSFALSLMRRVVVEERFSASPVVCGGLAMMMMMRQLPPAQQ